MVGLIVQLFFYLIIALLAVRFVSARMKKMQRQRKSTKFDEKYSKHWKRRY